MKIRLSLVMFVVDLESSYNKYVLLNNNDTIVHIDVSEDSDSTHKLIKNIISSITGITGNWCEIKPKLVGVLDDKGHIDKDGCRIFDLIYVICLPGKNRLAEGYKWVSLVDNRLEPLTNAVIKYAISNI